MLESITLRGPTICTITTNKADDYGDSNIICDWLGFRFENGFIRIEMITDNILTLWYYNEYSVIRFPPRGLQQVDLDRIKRTGLVDEAAK